MTNCFGLKSGRAFQPAGEAYCSNALRIANPRYSRLQTCAMFGPAPLRRWSPTIRPNMGVKYPVQAQTGGGLAVGQISALTFLAIAWASIPYLASNSSGLPE